VGVVLASLTTSPAHAHPAPPAILETGLQEQPGAQLPLDAPFTVAGYGRIRLRRFVNGTRPVLLVLSNASCPLGCSLVLRGVAQVARRMPLDPGRDYQLLLVGLAPRATLDETTRAPTTLLQDLGGPPAPARWSYLVGERASIDAITTALGFRHAWDARTEQYVHPAVIFVLTPDGRVSRYLHGLQFDPDETQQALTDAAAGRIVATIAADLLRWFRLDPASRRAGVRIQRFLHGGGSFVFLLVLGGILGLITCGRRLGPRS